MVYCPRKYSLGAKNLLTKHVINFLLERANVLTDLQSTYSYTMTVILNAYHHHFNAKSNGYFVLLTTRNDINDLNNTVHILFTNEYFCKPHRCLVLYFSNCIYILLLWKQDFPLQSRCFP